MKSTIAEETNVSSALREDVTHTKNSLEQLQSQLGVLTKDMEVLALNVKSIFALLASHLPKSPTGSQFTFEEHPPIRQLPAFESQLAFDFQQKPYTEASHWTNKTTSRSANPVEILKTNSANNGCYKTPPVHRVDFVPDTQSAPPSAELKFKSKPVTSRSRSYADIYNTGNSFDHQAVSAVKHISVTSSQMPGAYSRSGSHEIGISRSENIEIVLNPSGAPAEIGSQEEITRARMLDDSLIRTTTRGDSGIDVGKETEFGSRSTIISTDL